MLPFHILLSYQWSVRVRARVHVESYIYNHLNYVMSQKIYQKLWFYSTLSNRIAFIVLQFKEFIRFLCRHFLNDESNWLESTQCFQIRCYNSVFGLVVRKMGNPRCDTAIPRDYLNLFRIFLNTLFHVLPFTNNWTEIQSNFLTFRFHKESRLFDKLSDNQLFKEYPAPWSKQACTLSK
jgi:hypothetical protein